MGLRILSANHAFYEMFMLTNSETENSRLFELDQGRWNIPELKALLQGALPHDGSPVGVELDHDFPRIGARTLILTAQALPPEGKKNQRVLLAIEDVTLQRKQDAEKLRQSEERLRVVFESSPFGIATIKAPEGTLLRANPAFQKMLGYTEDELRGRPFLQLIHPADAKNHTEAVKAFLENQSSRSFLENRYCRKDGSIMWGRLAVAAAFIYHVIIIEDVTDLKKMEREIADLAMEEQRRIGQELHDSAGQELIGLAYMARSLVNSLAEKALPEWEIANKVVEGTGRALNQIRLIAKGLVPVEVDAGGLMAALADLAARTTELSGVECTFICKKPVSVHDNNAATHLLRIAQEAITNALKHGSPARIQVTLVAEGGSLVLRVVDDGKGIKTPHAESQGMGLRTMQYRADHLGATLTVGRSPSGGTQVTCKLSERGINA
jgi:PAS domain S-box-containing protein